MRPNNLWSAAETRRCMEQVKVREQKIAQKSALETTIFAVCAVFVVIVGMLVFVWPSA